MFEVKERIYTVSEITSLIKDTLEESFRSVLISGEISNCRPSSTGHLYFTLKDNSSVISAVMFKGRQKNLLFTPKDGMQVKAYGNISVYAQRGSYQLICESIEKAGEGDILLMLEERKKKLSAEGLFDAEKKRGLPLFPSRIAVVTSPTGAAFKDILRVTGRRSPGMDIIILPAPVQGADAGEKIAAQIRRAGEYGLGDVLIIGRGGGSLEDLLPFSEEAVVRAVAECGIPVISAVGHEIDTALSDYAADVCAPTPSAAAEIVSAGRADLVKRVGHLYESLLGEIRRQTERIRLLASRYTGQSLEESFYMLMQPVLTRFDDAKEDLLDLFSALIREKRFRLESCLGELRAVSPQSILKRGYSITTERGTGKLIASVSQTAPGNEADIRFHDGSAGIIFQNLNKTRDDGENIEKL
jgi:exodeoxyribonuclease VII large subunit